MVDEWREGDVVDEWREGVVDEWREGVVVDEWIKHSTHVTGDICYIVLFAGQDSATQLLD